MMTRAALLALAAQALTIVLAWRLALRRRVEHRPVALFASVVFVADVSRWLIKWSGFIAQGPFAGAKRIAFHCDQALFLSWPIGLSALSVVVFLRRRSWPALAVGALFWLALVIGYPVPFRQAPLGYAYGAAWGASALTSLACAASWTRRRAHPRSEHASTLLIILLDLSLFAGPYFPTAPHPFDSWDLAQVTYAMLWCALVALHVGALWFGLFSSRSSRDSSLRLH